VLFIDLFERGNYENKPIPLKNVNKLNIYLVIEKIEQKFLFLFFSTRTIVGTMLWTEYRPVIKIGPKGTLGSHEIRPIHSAPSLGQSID